MRYTINNMFSRKNLLMLIGHHAIIAISAIAIAALAIWFLAREIERISDTVVKNRNLVTMLEKRAEFFSTLERDAIIVGTNDTTLEHSFLSSDNILEFVSSLESIALKNTVTQNFNFENPVMSPISAPFQLSTIGYQNTVSLNIFALSNYLKDFERLPYFTKIDSLSISSQDTAGWRGTSNASFHATLYTKVAQ